MWLNRQSRGKELPLYCCWHIPSSKFGFTGTVTWLHRSHDGSFFSPFKTQWQIQNISALFSSFFVANIAVLITATVTDTCRLNQVRCWLLFTDCRAAALPLVDHAVLIMEQLSKLASSSQPLHTWCSISWYLPLDKTVKADCLPFLCLFVG